MNAHNSFERDRITIAVLALGGQGGGVLADWIRDVAQRNGWVAQTTSVPGVAQRTGSTVYYVEMVRQPPAGGNHPAPVLAMMPVPGDVDIVIASEFMEAGRAMLRGFVTADRTTLITSTHRVYAISEKSAAGDGIASSERILETARRRARRLIGFDMEAAASGSGSVISSIMLGALAGSGALPFEPSAFEEAIKHGGIAVAANLKGFADGAALAVAAAADPGIPAAPPAPVSAAGRALVARITERLPSAAHRLAIEGARRLMDYQDQAYAERYLARLEAIAELDARDEAASLTSETARWLALWMAYEDTIRVADLKIRATRSERVAQEAQLGAGQVMTVTEYMHPRVQEVCDILPARLGAAILKSPGLKRLLGPLFSKGRHVDTTSLFWFVTLSVVAALRPVRKTSFRFAEEQARIETWLEAIRATAPSDPELAIEMAAAPRLIKGYGDTFERGLARFNTLMAEAERLRGAPGAAARMRGLREQALADDRDAADDGPPAPLQIARRAHASSGGSASLAGGG